LIVAMAGDEWTVEDHLRDKSAEIIELYRLLVEIVESCGPFQYSVAKSAITFKGIRRGFAGAKPKSTSLDGYLDLQRVVSDPRILRSSPYTKRLFVHQFRVTSPGQLDVRFASWVEEAYEVGRGAHLA